MQRVRRNHVERFERDGFVVIDNLLSSSEVQLYRTIYDRFLSGEIEAGHRRSDLGAGSDRTASGGTQ